MNITKPTSAIAPRSALVVPTLGCSFGTAVSVKGSVKGSFKGFGTGYAATMRERHVDAAVITATPGTHAWRPPVT